MSKLLREYISLEYSDNLIEEAKKAKHDGDSLKLPALLQRADFPNQNERIYGRSVLEREVENYQKMVVSGRSGGELDHPDTSVVELKNVCHKIDEIFWKGDEVHGLVNISPHFPRGNDALGLLAGGLKVGISSRGVGETIKNEDGYDVVDDSYILLAFDLVSEPSTHEAWLMKEGKEVSKWEMQRSFSKIDRVSRIVNDILMSKRG